ncbi:hypothetical protein H0Z60_12880 [Ectothiorhodospiraceae bacterium WFHF3C12]|nr:hypothetical protein [Ectothiorhodospiraceae bacterium WFHF3C12]
MSGLNWHYDREGRMHKAQAGPLRAIVDGPVRDPAGHLLGYDVCVLVEHGPGLMDFSTHWLGVRQSVRGAKALAERYVEARS